MKRLLLAISLMLISAWPLGCANPSATSPPQPTPAAPTTPASPAPSALLPAPVTEATVTRVIDGDTIEVQLEGKLLKVRYIGLDTAEMDDPRGHVKALAQEATKINRKLVEGRLVRLEKDTSETDRYGRLLRYVYVGQLLVNAELVRLGYAQAVTSPPDVKYQDLFLKLQSEARESGRGLWAEPGPAPVPTPTSAPAPTPTPAPTLTPTPTPTPAPAPTSTPTPTPTSTPTPAPAPTSTPTPPASPAPAGASNVQITYIFYDGLVPRVESDEYVEITNLGDASQDLKGWVLRDISEGYPSFTFPSYVLKPQGKIRVYTNEIHPEWGGFTFGYGRAVWNNTQPDTAALYNPQGQLVSKKSY